MAKCGGGKKKEKGRQIVTNKTKIVKEVMI